MVMLASYILNTVKSISKRKGKYDHGRLARLFDISKTNVCNIINEKLWKHI